MKLLADENFPPMLISYLQKKHHDVKRIQRSTKTISDLFDFPYLEPEAILVYMDKAIESISRLKRRKKYFTATYSVLGLKLLE